MDRRPENLFRVTPREDFLGPPLTQPQQRVLAALVSLCPEAGAETDARAVAEAAGLRLGSVVLVLRALDKRRLAVVHDGDPPVWSPTMEGRTRVRHFPVPERPEPHRPAAGEPERRQG